MKALSHWRQYLGWKKYSFVILTDHANLQYWKSPKSISRRVARWHVDLQEYDFVIKHIPGKTNTTADALSRPPGADTGETDNKEVTVLKTEIFIKATDTAIPATDTATSEIFIKATDTATPSEEQKRITMQLVHDHPTAGHPG